MMNTAMQEPRRSPRILKQKSCFNLYFKERNRSEAANEDGERAIVHLEAVGQITIKFSLPANIGTFELSKKDISVQPSLPSSSLENKLKSTTGDIIAWAKEHNEVLESTEEDRNTPLGTLLSTITEGEKFLTSVKTKAIAHQQSTAELCAKLQVVETELKESAVAFNEEIVYFKEDVTARDDEIARLRGDTDKLSGERHKIASLLKGIWS
ncbi:hypothetical protein BOTCAL_0009g00250 [Botryotinia calthae]|uniref:Uncharacterized protein n=1 Tax=Botryotinia calthae TaxID=38488 RepID=A0A4Y8DGT7_9HELO|nr:hypothetical protein BOTCAL_0009g00250 [Botryotinia calthae]